MGIGNVRGKAIDAGGAGGSFDREDLAWLAQNRTLIQYEYSGHIKATGGTINDFTSPTGNVYRAHIFKSSGTLAVEKLSTLPTCPDALEVLVVAGGGGGGQWPSDAGGGGGAGGCRTNLSGHPEAFPAPITAVVGNYTVTVGGGGARQDGPGEGNNGNDSVFGHPTVPITSTGGGKGGDEYNSNGGTGGSGGGGGVRTSSPHTPLLPGAAGNTPPFSPPQGNPGGGGLHNSGVSAASGGGGGWGGAGENAPDDSTSGYGGVGRQCIIAGPPTYAEVGAPGPGGGTQWFGGGGGGSVKGPFLNARGGQPGGSGGSGIVIIRYRTN